LIENEPDGSPDKAKPSVRRERKAAGLIKSKMAELPKQKPLISSTFLLDEGVKTQRKEEKP
jgi:hypothetical protein